VAPGRLSLFALFYLLFAVVLAAVRG